MRIKKLVLLTLVSAGAASASYSQNTQSQNTQQQGADGIHGSGAAQYLTKFTGVHTVGNSDLFQNGPNLITFDNFAAANVSGTVNGALSIAMTAVNNTPDGSRDTDAWVTSGLIGLLAQTQSPASVGIEAQSSATVGDPVAVFGKTISTDRGIGLRGQAVAPSGGGFGVLGEALSSNGFAGLFNQLAPNGYPIAVYGYSGSADGGEGVHGQTNATTGLGIGVNGLTSSPNGFGGSFTNFAGGNILRGVNNATVVFRVDGNGTVFANGGVQPGGADFAESVAIAGDRHKYAPGDLLVIDSASYRQLALARQPYSTLVAGIYSTRPGVIGSTYDVAGGEAHTAVEIPLAIVGIVPCKVTTENGDIQPGDLLVTSSTPGHAMKGTDRQKMLGAVVGKALEPLDKGTGVIQVLVTLQ